MILIDSNVIIDVFENDPNWASWSATKIAESGKETLAIINDIVVAEVAPAMGGLERFYGELGEFDIGYERICDKSAFAAGSAFLHYRRVKQGPKSIIADFMIGGHAQTLGATILTRDPRFYRAYFPEVPLITPSKDDK